MQSLRLTLGSRGGGTGAWGETERRESPLRDRKAIRVQRRLLRATLARSS